MGGLFLSIYTPYPHEIILALRLAYLWQWDSGSRALDRAAELANKAIALDDSNVLAYAVRGWIAAKEAKRERAIADSEQAVSLDPNLAFGCGSLARTSTSAFQENRRRHWSMSKTPNASIRAIQKSAAIRKAQPMTPWVATRKR